MSSFLSYLWCYAKNRSRIPPTATKFWHHGILSARIACNILEAVNFLNDLWLRFASKQWWLWVNLSENICLVVISNFTVSFKRMSYHVKMQSSFSFSKVCMLYTSRCFSHFEMNEQEEKRVFTLLIGPKYFAKQIACVCWIFFSKLSCTYVAEKVQCLFLMPIMILEY